LKINTTSRLGLTPQRNRSRQAVSPVSSFSTSIFQRNKAATYSNIWAAAPAVSIGGEDQTAQYSGNKRTAWRVIHCDAFAPAQSIARGLPQPSVVDIAIGWVDSHRPELIENLMLQELRRQQDYSEAAWNLLECLDRGKGADPHGSHRAHGPDRRAFQQRLAQGIASIDKKSPRLALHCEIASPQNSPHSTAEVASRRNGGA
jgi:hypothetical protein